MQRKGQQRWGTRAQRLYSPPCKKAGYFIKTSLPPKAKNVALTYEYQIQIRDYFRMPGLIDIILAEPEVM